MNSRHPVWIRLCCKGEMLSGLWKYRTDSFCKNVSVQETSIPVVQTAAVW